VPANFYDQVTLNGPERDQHIENLIYTIRSIAWTRAVLTTAPKPVRTPTGRPEQRW
jgi:hypothetical protein